MSGPPRSSALLIDATMPWPYPPLSLPKREYLERAVKIWKQLQFPPLNLKALWFGCSFGRWTPEEEHEAKLAVEGRSYETGEKFKISRRALPE